MKPIEQEFNVAQSETRDLNKEQYYEQRLALFERKLYMLKRRRPKENYIYAMMDSVVFSDFEVCIDRVLME